MQKMQQELYEAHKDEWGENKPEHAKNHLLYMIEEMGECISIIKKKRNSSNNGRYRGEK